MTETLGGVFFGGAVARGCFKNPGKPKRKTRYHEDGDQDSG
ncbi:MAG: hypothetical protein R2722_14820 [Tessaracoccus sp.]